MINFKSLVFASIFLIGLVSSSGNIDFTRLKIQSENQTQIFYNRFSNNLSGLDADELHRLQNSSVILAPGFLGEWIQNLKGYFDPIKNWLKKNSIPFEIADSRSTRSSKENAAKIRELLKKSAENKKEVFIFAHSRGGLDTLQAISEDLPEVKISGIIILQSPLYGTWVSDAVAEWCKAEVSDSSPDRESFPVDCMSKIISLTGGREKARDILVGLWHTIMAMRSTVRWDWMSEHQEKLAQVFQSQKIPVLSIVTKDEGSEIRWTPYEIFRRKMWGIGVSNDGVVPSSSMKVPGTSFILLHENIDHSTLVEKRAEKALFQDRVFETAIDMLIDGSLTTTSND